MDNPFIGVALHAGGGVAHGSFYVPLKRVRGWAWESAWLVQGVAAWILMPWLVAWLTGSHPLEALARSSWETVGLTFLFGAMWGCGSLTFGLSMRYLGMSLGQAVALGYAMALGTLVPPLFTGHFSVLLANTGGRVVLLGVVAFVVFLTELVSNTASAALLLPVFLPVAAAMGLPPAPVAVAIAVAASCAFMLPVATPPNAIVFGTGLVRMPDMMKAGLWLNLAGILLIFGLTYAVFVPVLALLP